MQRIPTLDSWRGIAILLVLVDHIQDSLHGRYLRPWTQTGQHGVTIFFVLSGFLITSKLLEGPIDLRRFYIRRFFRLIPVAWAYLATLLLLGRITRLSLISTAEVQSCVLFYRNFFTEGGRGLAGHFWSLSLEEQFYLLWPCILLFAGSRRCRWLAGAGAIACASYRWLFWAHYDYNILNGQSQVRADALLVGCLLSLLLVHSSIRSAMERLSKLWFLPAFVFLIFCITRFHWLPPLSECISIACLIATTMLHPHSIIARLLTFAPLAWLGTISYSIYVWQEFFMALRSPAILFFFMPLIVLSSYYWIERPCTRFGHWIVGASKSYAELANV